MLMRLLFCSKPWRAWHANERWIKRTWLSQMATGTVRIHCVRYAVLEFV